MNKEEYQFEFYAGSKFYLTRGLILLLVLGVAFVAFASIYMDVDKGGEHDLSHYTLMIIVLAAVYGGFILYLIKDIFKEKDSDLPVLAGTKDEFIFRIDDELISIPWKDVERISYKKRSEYDVEGYRRVKHFICPYTKAGPDYEISIDKLDEDQYDIFDVLRKYHPELPLLNF